MGAADSLNQKIEGFLRQALKKVTDLSLTKLLEGYRLSAQSEGKSPNTIAIVAASVRYLDGFLTANNLSSDVADIGVEELRRFTIYLQERPRFAHHPITPPQNGHLSGHTINGYMRALQGFWSWLEREGFIRENPFITLRIPKPPQKIIPIFTEGQLLQLFGAVNITSPTGYRDYTIMLTLYDTGIRCSESIDLTPSDVNLDSRLLKVRGKGSQERLVPIGAKVQKALWKYLTFYRPEPATPRYDRVFLTQDGCPLTKDRLEAIVERYGRKAGITGVRVSPHTFRHTMAITFLRNGGDVFSLQRILGHSRIDTLRTYLNLAQSDVSRVHQRSSPADNLEFKLAKSCRGMAKSSRSVSPRGKKDESIS